MKDINKLKIAILPSILLIITLITAFYLGSINKKYDNLQIQITSALSDLKTYVKDPSKAPSKLQLEQIVNSRKQLEELCKHFVYTSKSMKFMEPELKLLEFKEKLTEIDSNYSKYNIDIPKGLGFKEYQGFTLPSSSEMKPLSLQLNFIIQIIDLLIGNNVEMISDIKRLPVNKIMSTLNDKKLFDIYHFSFSFKISHKNFLEFWNSLLSLPRIIRVKGLDIKSNFKQGDSSLLGQLLDIKINLSLMELDA